MFSVAICDNDMQFCNNMKEYFQNNYIGYFNRLDVYTNITDLISRINEKDIIYNIFFLNIDISETDGITMGNHIRNIEKDNASLIIYTGICDTVPTSVIAVHPYAYLKKSLDYTQLDNVIKPIFSELTNTEDYYIFYQNKNVCRIPYHSIIYIENIGRNAVIHCTNSNYLSTYSLSKISNELTKSNPSFIRIHTSYLINITYIEQFSVNKLKLNNGVYLPISRKFKNNLMSKINPIIPNI